MELLLQLLVNGIVIGSVYSLASLGYAVVFGLGINNFSHGTLCVLGAYVAYVLIWIGLPIWSLLPFVFAGGVLLGLIVYGIAVRRILKSSGWSSVFASTLAVAVGFENLVLIVHGSEVFSIRESMFDPQLITVGGTILTSVQLLLVSVSLATLVLLFFLLYRTKLGIEVRAVADDAVAAEAVGISSYRVTITVLALGGGLAAIAGLLIALDFDPDASVGTAILMKTYTATVIGGSRRLVRVVGAAYLIGIMENLVAGYSSSEYKLACVLLLLIIVLLFRKEGFGELGLVREV